MNKAGLRSTFTSDKIEPLAKRLFRLFSALCFDLYPRNINYVPAVKIFAYLDFERKSSFCQRPNNMEINVQLFAYFRENRFSSQKMTFPEGIRVIDIVRALTIDPHEIGVILINSKHSNQDTILSPDDTLSLYPLISGG